MACNCSKKRKRKLSENAGRGVTRTPLTRKGLIRDAAQPLQTEDEQPPV